MNRANRFQAGSMPRTLLLITLLLVVGVSAGCTTAKPVEDDQAASPVAETVRPGAEGWQRHALALPADSPVVFWARTAEVFDGLGGLRDWLFAEPAMFGESGDQMIAQARQGWDAVTAHLGMDPLASDSWQELGLDTSRDFYIGAYPVEDDRGKAYVDAFEGAVRQTLELDAEAELEEALATVTMRVGGDLPRGVHRTAAAAVSDHDPVSGFRAVVPVADRDAFVDNIAELMGGADYHHRPEGERDGESHHFFYDVGGTWAGVLMRVGQETAVMDVIRRPSAKVSAGRAGSADATEAIRNRLQEAVDRVDAGRPAAPKPPGTPVVGMAVDQDGAADFARLRGYRRTLERASASGVNERDAVFLQGLQRAARSAHNWTVASDNLSGVSYGLFAGAESDGFFRLSVTLFGAGRDTSLAVSPGQRTLGVRRRGMGGAVDLSPLDDQAWQSFVGVADPADIVDNFTVADFDPALFVLSFPRSLALLFANADKLYERRIPAWLEPVIANSDGFRRLEVASAGIDMRGLRVEPRLVGLFALDEETSSEERRQLSDAMAHALAAAVGTFEGEGAEERPPNAGQEARSDREAASSYPTGELIGLRQQVGTAPTFFYADLEGEAPYMFFSYGLGERAARDELAAVSDPEASGESAPRTVFMRAEPVPLLSVATLFEADVFEPLDVSVLAQRLGALVFAVEPEVVDGVQTIRYDVGLERPPALE